MLFPVQETGKGVNKDLLPSELAPGIWSDALNTRFRNGFAEKRKGTTAAYTTPTATPYWIGTFNTATGRYLVQLGTATAFVDDGTTRTEITGTPPTGARDDRWTGFDFNGVFVCNNGADDPMYWDGDTANNLTAIPDWAAGDVADALRPFKDFIFALAPTISGTKYPYRLMWSDAAEPGSLPASWTAAATNQAGDKDLPGIGHLVDAMALGDSLVVYGQEGRLVVRYIGGDNVFSFQQLPGKDGLMARGCVAPTPKGHVFLTNGDVRIHSGGESVSIAEGWVRKWIASTMDTTNAARSFVVLNPQETEVWVVFPSTGQEDCDTVAAWNWRDETWAIFSAPNLTYGTAGLVSSALSATVYSALGSVTYATITSSYNQNEASSNEARLIVATSDPLIGLANTGSLDFDDRVEWFLEKTGIPLSDTQDTVRSVSRMRPRLDALAGAQVTVKLATTMGPDDSVSYSGSSTYTQGSSTWANQFTRKGRYAAVRIEGADDYPVGIRSYQLEVPDGGGRF